MRIGFEVIFALRNKSVQGLQILLQGIVDWRRRKCACWLRAAQFVFLGPERGAGIGQRV